MKPSGVEWLAGDARHWVVTLRLDRSLHGPSCGIVLRGQTWGIPVRWLVQFIK